MPARDPVPPPFGRLAEPQAAPATGETVTVLVETAGARVEHILSGQLALPLDYDQDHDEWVLVLAGRARLAVEGTEAVLGPGDWLLLPAHRPHRLLAVEPGTAWLAVHLPPGGEEPTA
ncbi:cupin domain-containing protein [Aciditerrimonas ferrireducens]|uniref:Cupin domain-containing protein n=1 Tax=Aciditerrimonas ferrireducens TaxID=667306 RepID=A0ABV6C0C4_9ACTN|nr:cupin domain-containing protein [Aciditerrimonas ferrireducens]MCK4177291.1 cupin domain-containing protein [Aciditerrimonas ferrireducens]